MITGTIKTQVDSIWNAFWSGGISNPMEVIEQRAVCGEGRRSGMFIGSTGEQLPTEAV